MPAFLRRLSRRQLIALGSLAATVGGVLFVLTGIAATRPGGAPDPSSAAAHPEATTASPRAADQQAGAQRKQQSPAATETKTTASKASTSRPGRGTIPWTSPPAKQTAGCETLANAKGEGPSAYRLQQAIERGQSDLIRGRLDQAQVALCEAKLLGASTSTVLLGLAQIFLMKRDPDSALDVLDQLLQQQPNSAPAREMRGDVLIRLGRVDEAKGEWCRAAGAPQVSDKLLTDLLSVSRTNVRSALRNGDVARAERTLRRVVALAPKDADAAAELARVLLKQEETGAARDWLEYAAGLDANHATVKSVKPLLARAK